MADGGHHVEVVRGQLSAARADQVLAMWARNDALTGPAAGERLPQLTCVVLDGEGEVRGASSVYADEVPIIGNRRFWVYRQFLEPGVPTDLLFELLAASFDSLATGFDIDGRDPIGVCVLLEDRDLMARRREAVWEDCGFVYAGYLPDDRQVRIRYFDGAKIL